MIATGAAEIEVFIEGSGPLVVVLPSVGRESEDLGAFTAALAGEGFTVARPQPRGIGRSTGRDAAETLHDYANDVAAIVRALNGAPAVVCGHAYGNWIARVTAKDHPDLVAGVVLLAAGKKPPYPEWLQAALRKCSDAALPEEERLENLRLAFFAPGSDPTVFLGGWYPDVATAQRKAAAATPIAEWWDAGGKVPILEMQAADDPFMPAENRADLRNELGSRVTSVLVADASHALLPEQPRRVAQAVATFARKTLTAHG